MFPENEEAKELAETIEAMVSELDVANWYLKQLEGKIEGAEAAVVLAVSIAIENATRVASEQYSVDGLGDGTYFSEGFPWNYEKGDFEAYLARRESLYGFNS